MERYVGFKDIKDVRSEFEPIEGGAPFPTDAQVLFAAYVFYSYEGEAFVLFEVDGTLYEVNGGHCSCFGLEGQWEPEATSWEALSMRNWHEGEYDGLRNLIRSRLAN